MKKEMEYTIKIAAIRKLFRNGLLSEKEYDRVRNRLMDMYHVLSEDSSRYLEAAV